MQYNISLLIGLKNNLDYSKNFYSTTRKLYPEVEICFVSYGSTDGTHEWLDSLSDVNLKYYYQKESKTFSDTFNKAAQIATKDYVAYLHNDIVLAPNFIENLLKYMTDSRAVSYTTIEPPIFSGHERPGKIIKDFGIDIDSFNISDMYKFANEEANSKSNMLEPGVTFFMCMPRKVLLEIGGMDNLFNPFFCEDDDIINRLKLYGLEQVTSLDAICYHFVSKTSRFSEEYKIKTQIIEIKSNRNYIRKWGSRGSAPKYNTAIVLTNGNIHVLETLEPWCDRIYVENKFDYIQKEQPNTKFDLSKRVMTIGLNDPQSENDIVIEIDANKFNQRSFELLQQLPLIIKESGDIGTFELEDLKITINQMEEKQNDLIKLV